MRIDLSELLSVEDRKQDFQTNIEMEYFESKRGKFGFARKEPITLHIENAGKKKIKCNARIKCALVFPCDRCLEDVINEFDIEVNKEIDLNDVQEDSDFVAYIEYSELDVEKLVYNEILINLPMKVLCSENCKGICNRCGANLNSQTCNCETKELDPRMSKILDVFNNFKEV